MRSAKMACDEATAVIGEASQSAERAKNSSSAERDELRNLLEQIAKFLIETGSTTEDTRNVCGKLMKMCRV